VILVFLGRLGSPVVQKEESEMKVNSAFTWNELEEILVELLRVLWKEGFKTEICGSADSEGRPLHPLMVATSISMNPVAKSCN
jgi:hypothetical protein